MRKHHTRWVALFSAAAISASGLVGLAGPAAADDKDTKALSWPVVSQGVSSYSLDGYELTYLPAGLDRYGVNATSTTDRQGNSQSQLAWVQGPDQLYGRVAVLRSERLQELDDLREHRYSHLSESSLEQLPESETFEHGAYLAEDTGDVFWLESPGVAVTTHLQPDRWERGELIRMAESVAEVNASEGAETPAEEAAEDEASQEKAPEDEVPEEAAEDEAPDDETPAEETTEDETPADEAPEDEAPTEDVPAEEAPAEDEAPEEAPVEEAPVEEAPVEEAVDEEVLPEDAVDPIETPVGNVTPEAPEEEAPEEGATDEAVEEEGAEEATTEDEATEEAPVDEGADEGAVEEEADVDGSEAADAVSSREVKTCLTEHFVDFDSGSSDLDQEQMTPTSGQFVERALGSGDLGDDERDRLLATVWYYGDEADKVAATGDCADRFGVERSEVEDVISEVADLIAELIAEADQAMSDAMDQVEQASADTRDAASTDVEDPVGAQEWEELWDSLPWSIPSENS
ncbi:hypothetical protein [Nocardiopsis sp. MG754419]|uniref:hypothetical protein n=1 Tax=Nocardiopsis sp. MG754419 TaxID=2259865 RepID=UPI001BA6D712|nr:hypothetical protein [Nocardiopsis sp. MG754419]MBR8745379.1 hypothetical protein [Nocardiopsis sp. MG754419]